MIRSISNAWKSCSLTAFLALWGWLLGPANAALGAASFGVSLDSRGGSGDACIPGTIYNAEEGFDSGNLSASSFLTYSGTALGLDNGWPGGGCASSPVFGHVNDTGSAALGILKASATADMLGVGLIQSGGFISVGWSDTFTAITGGTYRVSVGLDATVSASPSCPSGNAATLVQYGVNETGPFLQEDIAGWNLTECSPNAGPSNLYGSYQVVNNRFVVLSFGIGVGQTFTINASLEARAGVGFGQTADADAGDTATVSVAGVNGATFSTASGATYAAVPEPATWLPVALALLTLGLRGRMRQARQKSR